MGKMLADAISLSTKGIFETLNPISGTPCASTGKLGNEKSILLAHNVSSSISSEIETHTSLKYSPTSPWRKVTIPVGSIFRASAVERAVTPKPYRH